MRTLLSPRLSAAGWCGRSAICRRACGGTTDSRPISRDECRLQLRGQLSQRFLLERPGPLRAEVEVVGDVGERFRVAREAEVTADDHLLASVQVAQCTA